MKRTKEKICTLLGVPNASEGKRKIKACMEEIGLETSITTWGIDSPEKQNIILTEGFNPDRVKNNPRTLTQEAVKEILEEIQ